MIDAKRLRASQFVLILVLVSGLIACSSSPPRKAPGVNRLVAIGDSITRGRAGRNGVLGHENAIKGGWVTQLEIELDRLHPGQFEIINKGIDGDTAAGVLKRMADDVVSYQPDIVIIAVGTNDVYVDGIRFRCLFGCKEANDIDHYRNTIELILVKLNEALPGTHVYLLGSTTVLKKYWDQSFWSFMIALPSQLELENRHLAYNQVLADLANKFGYVYVDLPKYWPASVEESWAFSADGIHPNSDGYKKISEVLLEHIVPE